MEAMETKSKTDGTSTTPGTPPSVEVAAKPRRRSFTAAYKLRVLEEVDGAGPGEQGAILRREGLYSSHICEWRAARRRGGLASLEQKRGRKPTPNPDAEQTITRLQRELAASQEELRKARIILDVQGKISGLLGLNFPHENNS